MSNHSGSYMLNEVLETLDKYSVFKWLGVEKTQELVKAVLKIGHKYDCNDDQILQELGRKVGICSSCTKPAKIVYRDLCQPCFQDHCGVDENGDISLSEAHEYWGYSQAEFLKWLQAENVAYRQEESEYYANFIALESCIEKRGWDEP